MRPPTGVRQQCQWQDNLSSSLSRTKRRAQKRGARTEPCSSEPSIDAHETDSVVVCCLPDEIDSPCHRSSQPDNQQYIARTAADKRHTPRSSGKALESQRLAESKLRELGTYADILHPQKVSAADMRIARSCGYTSGNIGGSTRLFPDPNAARPIE
jgi:hypothetical protein